MLEAKWLVPAGALPADVAWDLIGLPHRGDDRTAPACDCPTRKRLAQGLRGAGATPAQVRVGVPHALATVPCQREPGDTIGKPGSQMNASRLPEGLSTDTPRERHEPRSISPFRPSKPNVRWPISLTSLSLV
jgi:hypothetical protein